MSGFCPSSFLLCLPQQHPPSSPAYFQLCSPTVLLLESCCLFTALQPGCLNPNLLWPPICPGIAPVCPLSVLLPVRWENSGSWVNLWAVSKPVNWRENCQKDVFLCSSWNQPPLIDFVAPACCPAVSCLLRAAGSLTPFQIWSPPCLLNLLPELLFFSVIVKITFTSCPSCVFIAHRNVLTVSVTRAWHKETKMLLYF